MKLNPLSDQTDLADTRLRKLRNSCLPEQRHKPHQAEALKRQFSLRTQKAPRLCFQRRIC